ncbi:MAG: flagellar basal-body rod protein FlgF [Pseudomonadota bacterium]
MENAQLVTLSRMKTLERHMEVIANNVANLNTNGFKAEQMLFEEYIGSDASAETFERRDQEVYFVLDAQSIGDFNEGPISQTGNPLDVAIKGEGFFAVETPAGERYTRDGSFTIDSEGRLVTHDGHPVLGDGGPILFSPGETNISITADGVISTNEGEIGRLRVVGFDDPQQLGRIGSNLFSGDDVEPQAIERPQLIQNALEGANIDAVTGISDMIKVQRAYQELANIMRNQNDLRQQAISQLGTVQTA